MATYRIGIGTEFKLDAGVGIGTATPGNGLGDLRVEGTIKTTDLDVTGVSTFTRYAGFAADNIPVNRDTSLTGEHSTLGDIVVGVNSTFTVSVGATVDVGTVPSVSIGTHFSPPKGDINDRPEVPVEGTVRFNKDLNTLEFYNGVEWRQFTVNGASGRGVCSGGWNADAPVAESSMDVFSLTSQGNTVDFGTLTQDQSQAAGASSSIRGIVAGGGPGNDTHMEYYTMPSGGTGIDFGNLSSGRRRLGGLSSSSRAVFAGGRSPGNNVTIDYVEIMTLGDAIDFGDMSDSSKTKGPSTVSSPTRGIIANAYGAGTGIDAITISSKGNAVVVGQDLFHGGYSTNGASTGARGVWAGGYSATAASPYTMTTTSIRGIDIASGGNATEFGNLIYKNYATYGTGTGSHTRGFWMGGADEPAPAATKAGRHIVMMNLKSGGEAENWGDLSQGRSGCTAFSDSHGGLGGY